VWVNRTGAPIEQLGFSPDLIALDLARLALMLGRPENSEPVRHGYGYLGSPRTGELEEINRDRID
jgi:hypothetical protein